KVFVIFELGPGQRVMVVAHAQETAEAQHGIGDLAAALFDENPLDRADMLAVRVVDLGAFHLVGRDEIVRFLDVRGGDAIVIVSHVVLLAWMWRENARGTTRFRENQNCDRGHLDGGARRRWWNRAADIALSFQCSLALSTASGDRNGLRHTQATRGGTG